MKKRLFYKLQYVGYFLIVHTFVTSKFECINYIFEPQDNYSQQ